MTLLLLLVAFVAVYAITRRALRSDRPSRPHWDWGSYVTQNSNHLMPPYSCHELADSGYCTWCDPDRVVVGDRVTYIHRERQPA